MLRVPGTDRDLLAVKAEGGDVRIVYSPLDALKIARDRPARQVVFFAVGFETTAPGNAMAVYQARAEGMSNFTLLVSHVLVPPALEAMLASPACRVQGFLAAGHVCAVMGYDGVPADRGAAPRARSWSPGFEPLDILHGHPHVPPPARGGPRGGREPVRAARPPGGQPSGAQALVERGVRGDRPRVARDRDDPRERPGAARATTADYDAERRFDLSAVGRTPTSRPSAQSGEVLQGLLKPSECAAFGTRCTPERPLGATMVSSEGACAAYYRYRARRRSARMS